MPRRELLTPTERLQLLAFPEDAGELIRVLTLSKADIAFVRQHRGDHNRFGIAVLMAYLRYPGRTLAKDEPVGCLDHAMEHGLPRKGCGNAGEIKSV